MRVMGVRMQRDGADGEIAQVYDEHAPMLFRLACSLLHAREDAEDAVAEVFAKYVQKRPAFRGEDHRRAWLIRVTTNQCHDLQRRRSLRSHAPLEEAIWQAAPEEESQWVLSQVMELPEPYRVALTLHYLEELSVAQTAKALGLTQSGVKMRLARGREMLKARLEGGEKGHV